MMRRSGTLASWAKKQQRIISSALFCLAASFAAPCCCAASALFAATPYLLLRCALCAHLARARRIVAPRRALLLRRLFLLSTLASATVASSHRLALSGLMRYRSARIRANAARITAARLRRLRIFGVTLLLTALLRSCARGISIRGCAYKHGYACDALTGAAYILNSYKGTEDACAHRAQADRVADARSCGANAARTLRAARQVASVAITGRGNPAIIALAGEYVWRRSQCNREYIEKGEEWYRHPYICLDGGESGHRAGGVPLGHPSAGGRRSVKAGEESERRKLVALMLASRKRRSAALMAAAAAAAINGINGGN